MKNNLDEVSVIRPLLIILLVLYHSFAPWTGAWLPFDGFEHSDVYKWIGLLSYSFMLPTFVGVSGYVWAFQREGLGRKESLFQLALKKLYRLYIPCAIFSLIYSILFQDGIGVHDSLFVDYCCIVLNGSGHLWFLPMLFWCFIFAWILLRINMKWIYRLASVFFLGFLSAVNLPMGLGHALYYLFFFLLGYYAYVEKESITRKCSSLRSLLWIVFLIFFVSTTILQERLFMPLYQIAEIKQKLLLYVTMNMLRVIYSTLGMLAIYLSSLEFTRNYNLKPSLIRLGTLCMGIYVFHQFILKYLYYWSDYPSMVNSYLVPWGAFIIAFSTSAIMAAILRKTKIGCKLI